MRTLLLALALLGPVERLDWAVARGVQAARRPALEAPMHGLSSGARPPLVIAGLAVVLAVDVAAGAGWGTVRAAIVAVAGTNLVVEVVKRAVNRARPDGEHKASNASFPSSHAANAFALAWILTARWRRLGWVFFPLAVLVAFSRMYLNRHFLSDVVVGAAVGMLCAWAAARWLPPGRPRRRSPEAAGAG